MMRATGWCVFAQAQMRQVPHECQRRSDACDVQSGSTVVSSRVAIFDLLPGVASITARTGVPLRLHRNAGMTALPQNALPGAVRKLANHQKDPNAQEQKEGRCVFEQPKGSGRRVPDLNVD